MSDLEKSEDRTTVSIPKTDMDHLKEMATSFIDALRHQNASNAELGAKRLDLDEKELRFEQSVFKYKFWLLALGLAALLVLSCVLIFSKDKTDLGVSVLSHVAAIVGGVIAGIGYANSKGT